jgi:hypothetical protein
MTPQQLKELLMPVVESLAERFRVVEARVTALESAPLEWPKLDPIPSSTAADRLGMEPFSYNERS